MDIERSADKTEYCSMNTVRLYSYKKRLLCGAQFVRAHNAAGVIRTHKQRSGGKAGLTWAFFEPVFQFAYRVEPRSLPENASLERTPLALLAATPLSGCRSTQERYAQQRILNVQEIY